MGLNQNNKKLSFRRKKSNSEKTGIHIAPKDVVEIERNIIENWLIALKHWFHVNPSTARKIILVFFGTLVVFFLGLFTYSFLIEKQSKKFYSIMFLYESVKEGKNSGKSEAKLKKLLAESTKLCHSMWSTQYSNNGCLLSAILSNETGNKKDSAEFLSRYSKKVNNKALAAYTAFLSGYQFESSHDLSQSLAMYKKMDSYVDEKAGMDFALFHKGRIYYYDNKFKEAEDSFKQIIEKYKTGNYYESAKNYLLLVQLKKSQPALEK